MIKIEALERSWKYYVIKIEGTSILSRIEIPKEEWEQIWNGTKKADIIDGKVILIDNKDWISKNAKAQKAKEIDAIASLSDQLNLLADVCYILTEWLTEPKILEARKTLENIREILNK